MNTPREGVRSSAERTMKKTSGRAPVNGLEMYYETF